MRIALYAVAFMLVFPLFTSAYADSEGVLIILHSSFVDSEGMTNVVGTVRNVSTMPVQVTVGLQDGDAILQAHTYGRTIWPLTDSPFKFVLESDANPGEPFIKEIKQVGSPQYNLLVLTYDGMAVGEEKAFVGKIKNTAPFGFYNVSVFAAVHSGDHKSQLDTVRSNTIPVIHPGEELEFIAIPDPAIKSDILYYSCAGIDFDDPITILDAGNGQFIPYDLQSPSQVSSIKYESENDSISFGVRPYGPNGGPLKLKIPHLSENQTVTVILDGQLHEDASITGDGKTIFIDFQVPKGNHDVQIQGVRNVPEFPFAVIALSAMTAIAIVVMRMKKEFKLF